MDLASCRRHDESRLKRDMDFLSEYDGDSLALQWQCLVHKSGNVRDDQWIEWNEDGHTYCLVASMLICP